MLGGQLAGPGAHALVQQQLAARVERGRVLLALRQRALVGHRELADLGDRVAFELDAQRMVRRRGEHVHDAAAHRHIPPTGHHVLAHVRELRQLHQQVRRVEIRPLDQPDRLPAGRPRRDGLHHRSRRRHHDPRRVTGHHGTEHPQAATDRVSRRRETFMGQGLPARELGHLVVVINPRQLVGQLLTLALGGGDHQQRRLLRQRRHQERPQRLRRAHHRSVPAQPLTQVGQRRVRENSTRQTGEGCGSARGGDVRGGGGGGHACSASG